MVEKEIDEVEVQKKTMDEVRNEIRCRLMEGRNDCHGSGGPFLPHPSFVPSSRQPTH